MKNFLAHLALRVAERTGTLRHFNITVNVNIDGSRVRLPLGGHQAMNRLGQHEAYLLSAMREALQSRPGAVLDVGANIGQTLMKFLALNDPRPYVAFEPCLASAWQVQRLADANKATSVRVLPFALSDQTQIVPLYRTNEPFDVYSSITPDVRVRGFFSASSPVAAMIGDDVINALALQVALLKVDVEGAEAKVLRGLQETIIRDRPAIICELLSGDDARSENSARTSALLEAFGYHGRLISHQEYLFLPS
jgi:FkbM family methyltransferase